MAAAPSFFHLLCNLGVIEYAEIVLADGGCSAGDSDVDDTLFRQNVRQNSKSEFQ